MRKGKESPRFGLGRNDGLNLKDRKNTQSGFDCGKLISEDEPKSYSKIMKLKKLVNNGKASTDNLKYIGS